MHKSETGFSHVLLLVVFVALVVAGSGYVVYNHNRNTIKANSSTGVSTGTPSLAANTNPSNTASGVASTINSLTTSLNTSETSLDSQANATDQASDANLGTAASNLGSGYNANNY